MKIWITRPSACEVYMGGMRSIGFWVQKPRYDHRLKEHEIYQHIDNPNDGIVVYQEVGWSYGNSYEIPGKAFLKQEKTIFDRVWDKVRISVCPPDVDADQWSEDMKNWHQLVDDNYWEAQCRLSKKRFLLEVDICAKTVEFVEPEIVLPQGLFNTQRDCGLFPITNKVNSFYALYSQFLDEYGTVPRIYGSIDYQLYRQIDSF